MGRGVDHIQVREFRCRTIAATIIAGHGLVEFIAGYRSNILTNHVVSLDVDHGIHSAKVAIFSATHSVQVPDAMDHISADPTEMLSTFPRRRAILRVLLQGMSSQAHMDRH